MKHFDIKTYYRPDLDMAKMIGKSLYTVGKIESHRFQMALIENETALAFAKANPDALVMDLTYEELTGYLPGYGTNEKCKYVIVGVSLKTATKDIYEAMTQWSSIFKVGNISDYNKETTTPTENPNIFIIRNSFYVWNEAPDTKPNPTLNKVEEEWIKLWEGFDHYYAYSDSLQVYNRWNNKSIEIYQKGKEMGLSSHRMDEIYKNHVQ